LETVIGQDVYKVYSNLSGATTSFATTNTTINYRGGMLDRKMKTADDPLTKTAWDNGVSHSKTAGGFDVLPAGRWNLGAVYAPGSSAYFWTSSPNSTNKGWARVLETNASGVKRTPMDVTNLFSVRCKKN
jgi:uncharacterized protein (TIGR02145 family)